MVALPANTKATSIKILDKTEKELSSTYNILPAQEPQKIGLSIEFLPIPGVLSIRGCKTKWYDRLRWSVNSNNYNFSTSI